MAGTRVTSSEFRSHFADLSDRAKSEPVVIADEGQEPLVLVSLSEWQRLRRRDRRVGRTEDLPEFWIAAVEAAEVPAEFAHLDEELEQP